jgi:hypothetical protein
LVFFFSDHSYLLSCWMSLGELHTSWFSIHQE